MVFRPRLSAGVALSDILSKDNSLKSKSQYDKRMKKGLILKSERLFLTYLESIWLYLTVGGVRPDLWVFVFAWRGQGAGNNFYCCIIF